MKSLLVLATLFILLTAFFAMAHDEPPFSVELQLGDTWDVTHQDADPFKGLLTTTVTNSGTEPWGAFTFQIFDPTGMGQFTDVYFGTGIGDIYPQINGVTVAPENFVIDAAPNGYSRIMVLFPENPVHAGESITFVVYTDNTASQHSFFGVMMWPTSLAVDNENTSLSAVKALFR